MDDPSESGVAGTQASSSRTMRLVVISGLSGAGKSIALNALEDLGYYCVDNLPLGLLPALVSELKSGSAPVYDRVAVGIDARNLIYDFKRFPEILREVRGSGISDEVVFLEADDEVLIKRFSETRRRHPLSTDDTPLAEALRRERDLLRPVRDHASFQFNTSRTYFHELRDLIRHRVDPRPDKTMSLMFESFGFKHSTPSDVDMVFDVRCLPNPHWQPSLRGFTGRDQPVVAFLDQQPAVQAMYQDILEFLETWIPAFEGENRAYFTVAIGCTGGHHRSVYLVERLARHFGAYRDGVIVRHRELRPEVATKSTDYPGAGYVSEV